MSKKAKKFQTAAMKDSLTGLYNRNEFDLKIEDVLNVFNEKKERFSIIIFDIDKFKAIKCYRSQLITNPRGKLIIDYIRVQNSYYGKLTGCGFAEGFYSKEMIRTDDLSFL